MSYQFPVNIAHRERGIPASLPMKRDEFESRLSALVKQAGQVKDNVSCIECTGCEGCQACTFCRDGKRLVRCNYCVKCEDCSDCAHSRGCKGCLACVHCTQCERCTQSAYLVRCIGLTNCTYCFGCVGLSRKDFHILNEPYDRKTYFALVAKLQKELGLG